MTTPDIKCYGNGCALQFKCKRFVTVREYKNSTRFLNSPFTETKDKFACEDFIGNELEILKYNLKKR